MTCLRKLRFEEFNFKHGYVAVYRFLFPSYFFAILYKWFINIKWDDKSKNLHWYEVRNHYQIQMLTTF